MLGGAQSLADGRDMNATMLKRLNGKMVRIVPPVRRRWRGEEAPPVDEEWRIEIGSPSEEPFLRLHRPSTGHVIDVYSDGIQEYREPGCLVVKDQFTITENGIDREPQPDRRLLYRHQ